MEQEHQVIQLLENILGYKPGEKEIAGHIADSIAAQMKLRKIALFRSGSDDRMHTNRIQELRRQARELGLEIGKYPGIYRDG